MEALYIVLGMLAVWRATYMLQEETGPRGIFLRLQAWVWEGEAKPGSFKDGLRCFNCTSVWLAFVVALFMQPATLLLFFLYWLAIAAGAMIINKAYKQWLDK